MSNTRGPELRVGKTMRLGVTIGIWTLINFLRVALMLVPLESRCPLVVWFGLVWM